MKKVWICSLVCLSGCAALSGCQEKPDAPQTVVIELADPEDMHLEAQETEYQYMSVSNTETEVDGTEEGNFDVKDEQEESSAEAILQGLDDGIRLEYTRIASDDPVVRLLTAELLPEGIKLEDFTITNVQAYKGDEEIIPAGTVTFELAVEDGAQVTLYHLNEEGKLASEALEASDGLVSYEAAGCGRWLVLDAALEAETESAGTE